MSAVIDLTVSSEDEGNSQDTYAERTFYYHDPATLEEDIVKILDLHDVLGSTIPEAWATSWEPTRKELEEAREWLIARPAEIRALAEKGDLGAAAILDVILNREKVRAAIKPVRIPSMSEVIETSYTERIIPRLAPLDRTLVETVDGITGFKRPSLFRTSSVDAEADDESSDSSDSDSDSEYVVPFYKKKRLVSSPTDPDPVREEESQFQFGDPRAPSDPAEETAHSDTSSEEEEEQEETATEIDVVAEENPEPNAFPDLDLPLVLRCRGGFEEMLETLN